MPGQAADVVGMKMRHQQDIDVGWLMARRYQARSQSAQRCILKLARAGIDENAVLAILNQKRVDMTGHDIAQTSFHQELVEW
ncbi:hypothetical protein DYGSA30_31350 [Dyella sp. GSA-30]|nr:hypothetical protein DYGSA30_31350 [Dyella sp. GSA-30]